MSNILDDIITREQWGARHQKKEFEPHKPVRIVVHHSYSPSTSQWRGVESMRGIQNYHMDKQNPPWSDIGYHLVIAPDGMYAGRPFDMIGAHSGPPPTGSKIKAVFGNRGSIGICVIGNYDVETVTPAVGFMLKRVVAELAQRFAIQPGNVFGHFESWSVPPKTCPGKNMAEYLGWAERFAKAFKTGK